MKFQGSYNDGKVSTSIPVKVIVEGSQLLKIKGKDIDKIILLNTCKISPPLGKTRRYIELEGGGKIETSDLGAMENLSRFCKGVESMRWIHGLESRWPMVLLSLVGVLVFIEISYRYGIPFLAKSIAYRIPQRINIMVSDQTLFVLDKALFKPSELNEKRKDELSQEFKKLALNIGTKGLDYQLEFRSIGTMGANAFALPSGTIIIIDDLITQTKDGREILAVLAHEMVHIEKRHGMRSVLQDAGVFFLLSVLLGDITSVTSLSGILPTLLAESNYSREFEREADKVAGRYCIEKGWGTAPLRNALLRLAPKKETTPGEGYVSTHPETRERVEYLLRLEKEMAGRSPQ